jgi:hypothetical protein
MRKFFLLTLIVISLKGYTQDYSTVHPAPNIGWGLVGIKQENQLYAGNTRLTIPIYTMAAGQIKIPLSLSYYPAGWDLAGT